MPGVTSAIVSSDIRSKHPKGPVLKSLSETHVSLVERIVAEIGAEADRPRNGAGARDDVAELHIRLAVFLDDLGKAADAQARVAAAGTHPLIAWIMLAHAIAEGTAGALQRVEDYLEAHSAQTEDEQRRDLQLYLELAESWMYRIGDLDRAWSAAQKALTKPGPSELHELIRHAGWVSRAAAGDWVSLANDLVEAAGTSGSNVFGAVAVAEALHIFVDRLNDHDGATAALERARELLPPESEDRFVRQLAFYAQCIGIEVVEDREPSAHNTSMLADILEQRAILAGLEGARSEYAAISFKLAMAVSRDNPARANEVFAEIAAFDHQEWGPWLATIEHIGVMRRHGDVADLIKAIRQLGREEAVGSLASAYLRRAAQLADAKANDGTESVELWRQLLAEDSRDGEALRAIQRISLAASTNGRVRELIGQLEGLAQANTSQRAGLLRQASALAESRAGDIDKSIKLARASMAGGITVGGAFELARRYRRQGDATRLAEMYRTIASVEADRQLSALFLTSAGIVELMQGRVPEAEAAFSSASKRQKDDVASRIALAAVYRFGARWHDLVRVLDELAPLVAAASQVQLLRELGQICLTRLNNTERAQKALSRALELEPSDADTLQVLSELHAGEGDWARAVELRRHAVEQQDEVSRKAQLLIEIGRIEETRLKDLDAALVSYRAASDLDGAALDALRAQSRIYADRKDLSSQLEILRKELTLDPPVSRVLAIHLEMAVLSQRDQELPAALAAYREALNVDAHNEAALAGLAKIGRTLGKWEAIAEAYRMAAETHDNLQVLADALEQLEAWSEYASVREKQLELSTTGEGKAQVARQLAQTYEQKLRDSNSAIKFYERSLELDQGSQGQSRSEILRLLEHAERWDELAAHLAEHVQLMAVDDSSRLPTLVRLAELYRSRLKNAPKAAETYEKVLAIDPEHAPSLGALDEIYAKQGRQTARLRVLEVRARVATTDEQNDLYQTIADLKGKSNDVDGTIEAYRRAFDGDPSNRDTFTALEKLCYEHERWSDVMALYTSAIDLVEGGAARAYRLGDLYARRGQVQLHYLNELAEAAVSYLRVVDLEPDNDTAIKFLESIFSQQGDWKGLVTAYEKRARLTQDETRRQDTLRKAARIAGAKLKDSDEAARIYELIAQTNPADEEALAALERFYERTENWDKLVGILQERMHSAPAGDDTIAMLRRIAQIAEEGLRDEKRATEHHIRILEIAPGNKASLEALGRIYESTEQWVEFIDITRRQIRVTTDRNVKALLYFKCGSVMEAKFRKEEDAIRYYDAAIKTSPSCLPAVHGLRDLYRRRQDWPRVIQTLELEVKLWQDDKERAGVFAQIGRIYAERLHEPDRAMHYYESALAVDPECLPANKALFEHYFDAGEWQRAQPLATALAQKAMREGDPSQRSEFYRKRGVVAQMTGDARTAAENLIVSLELRPMNIKALIALGELAKVEPEAYGFQGTYRELEKLYRRRDDASRLLAHVRAAQAVMKEREGDLDAAEELYGEASGLAKDDFEILYALVDLHTNMRRWPEAAGAIRRYLDSSASLPVDVRIRALMRLAEIHSDCELDSHRAVSVLKEVTKLDSGNEDAFYRLAQELYLLGRFDDAQAAVGRAIQLAAAPGKDIRPEHLARYYYYLGRVIASKGDTHGATSKYRRAAEYDPSYAPPVLALANRAVEVGRQEQAERLLIDAAHAAMECAGAVAAVPLQRGLARVLLASGNRPDAIEAYRGILNVEPNGATDRVALAEIYALDDMGKAVSELKKVITRDFRHAPAYRLLAHYYSRAGESDRALRVLAAMETLGFADNDDRAAAAQVRQGHQPAPLRAFIEDELRDQLLVTRGVSMALGQLFKEVSREVTALFPPPSMGENVIPAQMAADPRIESIAHQVSQLYRVKPEIYVGERVPSSMAVMAFPRPIVVLDRAFLSETDEGLRFALGYALEGIRGGYALLFSLGRRQRLELGSLLKSLLLPQSERAAAANDFVETLPRRVVKTIERLIGRDQNVNMEEWIDDMLATAKRAGLFTCDDFHTATRVLARLAGEEVEVGGNRTDALGTVLCGPDLVKYYISDDYHQLREIVSNPTSTKHS